MIALESIGGRLERLTSRDRAARQSRSPLARPGDLRHDAAEDDEDPTDSRVETALSKIEARAALNEQRTARALETVADWIERDASPPAAENARIAEVRTKERAEMERTAETRAAPARPPMAEPTKYDDIDQRLEALAKRMEAGLRNASSRPRPQSPNEPSAAHAEPQRRPTAANDAGVETPRAERPLSDIEAESLHAEIAAMRKSLADLAPRNAGVALEGALLDFGQRLAATRRAALNPEALKPIEDGLREALDALRRQNLQPAAGGVERDLSALNLKIDALARSSVDPELLEQIRRQSEDTRRQVAAAALQSTPLTRIEREVERLADRVERLATRPVPQADIDALARALDETRHKIERAAPPSALASIAQRLAALTTRIDDALRAAAAPNPRPLEDLTRRVEAARALDAAPAALDPRGDVASRARKLESTLANLHAKFDNAALASSSSSESLNATLKQLLSRLEDVAARASGPRAIDAAPFKDLGQRIDAVRASLDQLSDLSAHTRQLEAAFADLSEKLDASIGQSVKGAQLNSALQQLVRRIEDLAARPAAPQTLDAAPFRDLARRIDAGARLARTARRLRRTGPSGRSGACRHARHDRALVQPRSGQCGDQLDPAAAGRAT